jgi:2-succinyl-6-hydroxy-2,4-cyclohexadiene-1-carboxylate synthase
MALEVIDPAGGVDGRPVGPTRPLLLLHGFTQTRRSWGRFASELGTERTLVLADLPGHGSSAALHADLWETADLVAAALRETPRAHGDDGRLDVLGYSLGARVALHLAIAHPELVHRLVLVSGTAGIADGRAREARRQRDGGLADRLESEADVEGFLDRWLAAPMFATLPAAAAARSSRSANTASGLAASLRLSGTGAQDPLWGRLGEISVPVLVVTGATDIRFTVLGERIVSGVGGGVLSVVPGAGHAAHLEQPGIVARLVSEWLVSVGGT